MSEGTETAIDNTTPPAPDPILGFEDAPARRTIVSSEQHLSITPETLSEQWNIGHEQASATLCKTRQRGTRSAILPLARRYRADLHHCAQDLNGRFATDTIYADVKSLENKRYAQVYTHKNGFSAIYPIERLTGDSIGETLNNFTHEFSAPDWLVHDGAAAQTRANTRFQRMMKKYDILSHVSEKG